MWAPLGEAGGFGGPLGPLIYEGATESCWMAAWLADCDWLAVAGGTSWLGARGTLGGGVHAQLLQKLSKNRLGKPT